MAATSLKEFVRIGEKPAEGKIHKVMFYIGSEVAFVCRGKITDWSVIPPNIGGQPNVIMTDFSVCNDRGKAISMSNIMISPDCETFVARIPVEMSTTVLRSTVWLFEAARNGAAIYDEDIAALFSACDSFYKHEFCPTESFEVWIEPVAAAAAAEN